MTADRGGEELWRDVSAVARDLHFDIHFRIVDATTMAVVLTQRLLPVCS